MTCVVRERAGDATGCWGARIWFPGTSSLTSKQPSLPPQEASGIKLARMSASDGFLLSSSGGEEACLQPSKHPQPREPLLHSCPSAEWGSNRLVLQTAQRELDCEGRRGKAEGWGKRNWGEEGREREGAGREEEPVKTPDSTPNPCAKSLSKLILISERFTWVEHCF